MSFGVARKSIIAGFALLALAGCKTDGSFDLFGASNAPKTAAYDQPPTPETTGTLFAPPPPQQAPENGPGGEVLLGNNPKDDLKLGKKHYRENNYGLAERYFRRSVEANPRSAEGWMGLAASYDRLRRFDLADRAYEQAFAILGPAPELLNNHGYSFILRGDYKNARAKLMAAKAKDPNSPYIRNNIALLQDSIRNAR